MDNTMEYFSHTLKNGGKHDGVILLNEERENWVWKMHGNSEAYCMCWVEDLKRGGHAMALAVRDTARNYKVRFFDPNFGECRLKDLADFRKFATMIHPGFKKRYGTVHLHYRAYCP
jgi:hypothetical protein